MYVGFHVSRTRVVAACSAKYFSSFPSPSSVFAMTEAPWLSGLVTAAWGFIVFVKVFSVLV